ncbi:MAG TPA: multicopper oxidase [Polyangiaceae bacterium]|nr:multicopper oxidase [Polyangiaceae bacterium]
MKFNRVSISAMAGIAWLPLVACSASEDGMGKAGATSERVDQRAVGSEVDPLPSNEAPRIDNPCQVSDGQSLDPEKIKWKNSLERPRVFVPKKQLGYDEYTISIRETQVQMLPRGCPLTTVFAYGGSSLEYGKTIPEEYWGSPGASFEMTRGTPAHVVWVNEVTRPHFLAVDPTLHWANPNHLARPLGPFAPNFPAVIAEAQEDVSFVTHVHGLEVASDSDGAPEAWFTASKSRGPLFEEHFSEYPNSQPATTLWYHDHALGITRLNVYAGLAGMYIIRDPHDTIESPVNGPSALPDNAHEMPLVIQDKSFNADGSLSYPSAASAEHPYWSSSFFGDTMVVNGKAWPTMQVERARYRFRILNGANSRTFDLSLTPQLPLTVIGSDGGYLARATNAASVKLAPGERADVVIDFSSLKPGEAIVLGNAGEDIVQFKALENADDPQPPACSLTPELTGESKPPACFPKGLSELAELQPNAEKRTVTLVSMPDGGYSLNGQMFDSPISEQPRVGSTEDWDIVNISSDDHPIHLHLVQFRILNRQVLDADGYTKAWNDANGGGKLPLQTAPQNPAADAYIPKDSLPVSPAPAEAGWKDTVLAPAGSVTRIRVRWAPQDAPPEIAPGSNAFPFDPTRGTYLWHCHMLEHEDNEMMRPLKLGW